MDRLTTGLCGRPVIGIVSYCIIPDNPLTTGGANKYKKLNKYHKLHQTLSDTARTVTFTVLYGPAHFVMSNWRLYRIHNYSTSLSRVDNIARRIKFCVRWSHLHRLSPNGRRFYKASRCCKSPFVRGERPNGQSNGSYRVRVHVTRATESQNVARMPRRAGTSPCGAHLQQADDTPRCHGVDLSFLLSDRGGILSEKWLFPKNG